MILNPYSFGSSYDADAATYFAAIATAGSSISTANKTAVNAFVVGCKTDGIWTAIKASCLLCAADDLTGALVPLVGSAPTNNNFVSGDYSRTTGLLGNGSNKRINSNRNNNADPQNNNHNAVWITAAPTLDVRAYIAGDLTNSPGCNSIRTASGAVDFRSRRGSNFARSTTATTGFIGMSRAASGSFTSRIGGSNATHTDTSSTAEAINVTVFSRSSDRYIDARMSFYSIGEALDLALLDARLTTLMAALT